jgi:hypothetical protein
MAVLPDVERWLYYPHYLQTVTALRQSNYIGYIDDALYFIQSYVRRTYSDHGERSLRKVGVKQKQVHHVRVTEP